MPPFGPIHRRDLIHYLRKLGFEGPYSGGKHEFMIQGHNRVYIPNPHSGNISRDLLTRILLQAAISRDEWEHL